MKTIILIIMTFFAFLVYPTLCPAIDGFSGTIYFRNGDAVYFDHIGTDEKVLITTIDCKLGSQKVKYRFDEIREIYFTDKNTNYNALQRGSLIVVNKQGDRYTLEDCIAGSLYGGAYGNVTYAYNDPVTASYKYSTAQVRDINHLVIGESIGRIKYNHKTKEYFPSMYVFDPFTGQKLKWSTPK